MWLIILDKVNLETMPLVSAHPLPLAHTVEGVSFGSFEGQPCIKSCDFARVRS